MEETPAFTLNGSLIIENLTGYMGQIRKKGEIYTVDLLNGPDDNKKRENLCMRMRNWYIFRVLP